MSILQALKAFRIGVRLRTSFLVNLALCLNVQPVDLIKFCSAIVVLKVLNCFALKLFPKKFLFCFGCREQNLGDQFSRVEIHSVSTTSLIYPWIFPKISLKAYFLFAASQSPFASVHIFHSSLFDLAYFSIENYFDSYQLLKHSNCIAFAAGSTFVSKFLSMIDDHSSIGFQANSTGI